MVCRARNRASVIARCSKRSFPQARMSLFEGHDDMTRLQFDECAEAMTRFVEGVGLPWLEAVEPQDLLISANSPLSPNARDSLRRVLRQAAGSITSTATRSALKLAWPRRGDLAMPRFGTGAELAAKRRNRPETVVPQGRLSARLNEYTPFCGLPPAVDQSPAKTAMSDPVEAIRSCKYLFLHSITEPEENALRVVLHEARVGDPPDDGELAKEPLLALRDVLAGSRAIVHVAGCRVFELTWSRYVGYSVENESYGAPEPKESVGKGRLIVEYTRSVYLSYLAKATFASDDYPGPFTHWALHCLNHIVNVASVDRPQIAISVAGNAPQQKPANGER
jgi:hypothetical protein